MQAHTLPSDSRPHARPRAGLSLLAGLAIAALASGCGGSDAKKNEAAYKKAATALTAQTSKLGQDLGTAIQGAGSQTDAQLATTFSGLARRGRTVVAKLKALKPPSRSSGKVDALAAALSSGATDIDAIAAAGRSHDAKAAQTATQTLLSDSPAIKSANRALKADLASAK